MVKALSDMRDILLLSWATLFVECPLKLHFKYFMFIYLISLNFPYVAHFTLLVENCKKTKGRYEQEQAEESPALRS